MARVPNLGRILDYLLPGCLYTVTNEDPDLIEWLDPRVQPSNQEIEDAEPAVTALLLTETRAANRASLKAIVQGYIDGHFPFDLMDYFSIMYLKYLHKLILEQVPTQEEEDQIVRINAIWAWVGTIIVVHNALIVKLNNDEELTPQEIDMETQFDATRPV